MLFFFFQAEDGIRDKLVTGVQTCALPILIAWTSLRRVLARPLVIALLLFVIVTIFAVRKALLYAADPVGEKDCPPVSQIGRASCRERGKFWWVPDPLKKKKKKKVWRRI